MKTKSNIEHQGFIAKIFYRIWIGAASACLYFLAMALFFDGKWSQFIWLMGISAFAKLLSIVFDRKNNAHSAKLIAESHPSTGAEKNPIKDNPTTSHKLSQANVVAVIEAFGETLETAAPDPDSVADASKLPYPKDTIKKAIIAGLKSTDDENMKEQLKYAYIRLADWQTADGTEMAKREQETLKNELLKLGL